MPEALSPKPYALHPSSAKLCTLPQVLVSATNRWPLSVSLKP